MDSSKPQADSEQRGMAAHIRQCEDNTTEWFRTSNDGRILNNAIHDRDLMQRDERLKKLTSLSGPDLASNRPPEKEGPTLASAMVTLAPALMGFGKLAIQGASAYRESQERKRREEERRAAILAVAAGCVVLLWYAGWLYAAVCLILCALSAALLVECCPKRY